ncbi:MAG: Fe2+-dependent dioxygenase [Gammaproteobacteria bacterium]
MLVHVPAVLDQSQLAMVWELLSGARYEDGRASAGLAAKRVKNNQELSVSDERMSALNRIVMGRLVSNPTYLNAALPHRVAAPFYARYAPGMAYGDHVDDPVMGSGDRYRSDISITVFLSPLDSYDGGELVIQTAFGERRVKLPAGDAILYPSSSVHRVAEVTRGERLVAVTWVQSLVRDPARRELLYDLSIARDKLLENHPEADETRRVHSAYVNLVRMWAEL